MATDAGTILLVEDNPRDEELTLLAFEDSNIANEIVVARDGVEALDYLFGTGTYHGRAADLPNVVLLDLKLPKLDGLEVLTRIRGDTRTALLPVVVLTSSDEEKDMLRSYELGVNAYIQKPVDFDQFIQATKTLGLFWAVLNRVPYRKQER